MDQQVKGTEPLKSIFKEQTSIPEEYIVSEIHQKTYLLNGEIVPWNGQVTEVYSPVCIPTDDGPQRKLLGSIPNTTGKEALEALEAAVAAYDNGLGEWPTMSVEGRIKCMQKFVYLMIQQRELVIGY